MCDATLSTHQTIYRYWLVQCSTSTDIGATQPAKTRETFFYRPKIAVNLFFTLRLCVKQRSLIEVTRHTAYSNVSVYRFM